MYINLVSFKTLIKGDKPIMARPLTKFGELKKVLKEIKLPAKDVNEILDKTISELKARTPTNTEEP